MPLTKATDLTLDPQIRAVVAENVSKGAFAGPLIALAAIVVGWVYFRNRVYDLYFIGLSLLWLTNGAAYVIGNIRFNAKPKKIRHSSEESSRFLRFVQINRWIDHLCVGFGSLLLYFMRTDLVLSVVIGAVMYTYVSFVKNATYSPVTKYVSVCTLTPLTMMFFATADRNLAVLAIYFLVNVVYLRMLSPVIATNMQLPIKQRIELELLTEQLVRERERADAANEAKSRFFTAASHDARQPLQVISLLFESFQRSKQASLADKITIEKIAVNLNVIRGLFDRVLDISRIDAGHIKPNFQAIELQKQFNKLDAQFGELASTKGLWLRFSPTKAWVRHDPELLERMLSNLIHNAIKYTDKGGVWVGWRAGRQQLEIRDSGRGIDALDQPLIFDEFAQINNPARNNEAGLGLGLSIVKRLADLTNTSLGVRSANQRGSTFWLKLEVSSPSSESDVQRSGEDIEQRMPIGEKLALTDIKILYVEDEPQLLALITKSFERAGASVQACFSVLQAMEVMRSNLQFDILITDFRLGANGTGLDLVQTLRERSGWSVPTIILTGDSAVKDLLAIQNLTNKTLLHKPVDEILLHKTVIKMCQKP
jgi:two-component system, sensor histidine kinase